MDFNQCLSAPLIFSALVLVLTWWFINMWHSNRKLPPGPWGLPLLGCFPFIKANHEEYSRLRKIYGNVFSFRSVGGRLIVILNGAKVIKDVLINRADEFDGRPPGSNLVTWISKGLGITQEEGEVWSVHRRFFLQTIRNFGVGKLEMEEKIQDEIRPLVDELRKSAPEKPDLHFHIAYAMNNVISQLLFNKKLDRDHTFRGILSIMEGFIEVFLGKVHILNGYAFDLMMILFPSMRKFQKNRDGVQKFVDEIVEEQIATFDPAHIRGYVDAYLQEKGKLGKSSFTKARLQANVMNLFFEGTESTSSTISSMFLKLSKYPDVQKTVQEELDSVVGQERLPSWLDRQNLPYLDATIQELFRMSVVFLVTTHYSNFNETTIEGYRIPRRSIIISNLGSIHFDPEMYPEPQVFNPRRFLNEEGKRIKREGPYPFGLGKRSCIGESLAQMEVFLVISSILQNFTLYPGSNEEDIRLEPRN